MKNTQLRTTNLVHHNGIVKTVDSICRSMVTFIEDCPSEDKYGEWIDLDEVVFITLTEEWLLKLGFIKLWHINKFQYAMYISESLNIEVQIIDERILLHLACTNDNHDLNVDMAYFTTMLEVKCDFVNQFQNLYHSLTSQELEVKNES